MSNPPPVLDLTEEVVVLTESVRRQLKSSKSGTDAGSDTYFHIGPERFAERLSLIAEILLACVGRCRSVFCFEIKDNMYSSFCTHHCFAAFQYLVDESIPKMGFLTTIDWLLMSSYIVMFFMALQTFALLHLSLAGDNDTAVLVDWWCALVTPFFYVFLQVYHIGRALLTRNEKTQAAREGKGVHANLLFENANAVDMVVHEKGSSSVGGGSSSSFNTNNQFDMMNSRANVSQFNPSSKLRQRKSLLKNTLRFARSSIVGIGAGAGDLESGSVDVESSSKYTIES